MSLTAIQQCPVECPGALARAACDTGARQEFPMKTPSKSSARVRSNRRKAKRQAKRRRQRARAS